MNKRLTYAQELECSKNIILKLNNIIASRHTLEIMEEFHEALNELTDLAESRISKAEDYHIF